VAGKGEVPPQHSQADAACGAAPTHTPTSTHPPKRPTPPHAPLSQFTHICSDSAPPPCSLRRLRSGCCGHRRGHHQFPRAGGPSRCALLRWHPFCARCGMATVQVAALAQRPSGSKPALAGVRGPPRAGPARAAARWMDFSLTCRAPVRAPRPTAPQRGAAAGPRWEPMRC
jgi:hypothetical protein